MSTSIGLYLYLKKKHKDKINLICFRWSVKPLESLQFEAAAEEETKITNRLHEPPDIRTRKAVPLPEVPITG